MTLEFLFPWYVIASCLRFWIYSLNTIFFQLLMDQKVMLNIFWNMVCGSLWLIVMLKYFHLLLCFEGWATELSQRSWQFISNLLQVSDTDCLTGILYSGYLNPSEKLLASFSNLFHLLFYRIIFHLIPFFNLKRKTTKKK